MSQLAVRTLFALLAMTMVSPAEEWWEKITTPVNGRLVLTHFPWWKKAQALKPGEKFYVDVDKDGRPELLVRREEKNLVVIISDGHTMKYGDTDGNKINDCYLVDYDADGVVDRMVDYIDNDGDGVPDEMEMRYYQNGELRYAWFWEDIDKDGLMWDLKNYEYSAQPYKCDMQGDNHFYLNKYDTAKDEWIPFSECPFAFFDLDHDGRTEAVVRVSASPLGSDKQHDYANNYKFTWAPMEEYMRKVGNVNVRLSYSIKNADTPLRPYACDMGFTMSGAVPYRYEGMEYTNPRRRAPKTVRRIPWNKALEMARTYPAQQTGFTWDEYDTNDRWEGIFWLWERRLIPNTGGPNARWNLRREYDKDPSAERKIYYSGVDRRIHLFHAQEGWVEVGRILGSGKLGEIRMLDTDGDGYFDTWEYDLDGDGVPERTTTVRDEKARMLPLDWKDLNRFYTQEVLPGAIRDDQALIEALQAFGHDPATDQLLKLAQESDSQERKRFLLDLVREKYFEKVLADLQRGNKSREVVADMTNSRDPRHAEMQKQSTEFWRLARKTQDFRQAYLAGDLTQAAALLKELAPAQ